ncbi:RICIN domain-containing protein [Streptomyces sp. NPDC059894]|uniref:RICIN domain-containing protein n=1 Tax=unclassified Streptomyces TaxID=2593676 RepID=UPI0036579B4D
MRPSRARIRTKGLLRRLLPAPVALALTVPALLVGASAGPAAAATPAAGGTYTLAVTKSGKCLDVVDGSTANKALLQQWNCHADQTNQQWTVIDRGSSTFELKSVGSGKCLDVPDHSTTSGIQLQQYTCVGSANQLWRFTASGTGTYQVVNVGSGLCVSDLNAATTNGNPVIQETCTHNTNKQWAFTPVSDRTWPSTADGFAATAGGTTGGAAGTTVTVSTYADLVTYASATAPYVIKVAGTITVPTYGYEIPVKSDKTIVGVGTTGEIVNGGLNLGTGVHNVIIRNLTIRDTRMTDDDPDDKVYDYDGIQMDTADHIWIDHNRIERMNDGLIDSRKDTSYLTVSWNELGEVNKAFGIGWTDNVTARMTIHHNWIHDTNQRNPSIDNVALAHLYNNYLQNITSYGNLSRGAAKTVIENSYYENVNNPYSYDTTAASLTQTGSVLVNCTGDQKTNGTTFTPSSYYSYTLDPAADVPALLRQYSGPQPNIGT